MASMRLQLLTLLIIFYLSWTSASNYKANEDDEVNSRDDQEILKLPKNNKRQLRLKKLRTPKLESTKDSSLIFGRKAYKKKDESDSLNIDLSNMKISDSSSETQISKSYGKKPAKLPSVERLRKLGSDKFVSMSHPEIKKRATEKDSPLLADEIDTKLLLSSPLPKKSSQDNAKPWMFGTKPHLSLRSAPLPVKERKSCSELLSGLEEDVDLTPPSSRTSRLFHSDMGFNIFSPQKSDDTDDNQEEERDVVRDGNEGEESNYTLFQDLEEGYQPGNDGLEDSN